MKVELVSAIFLVWQNFSDFAARLILLLFLSSLAFRIILFRFKIRAIVFCGGRMLLFLMLHSGQLRTKFQSLSSFTKLQGIKWSTWIFAPSFFRSKSSYIPQIQKKECCGRFQAASFPAAKAQVLKEDETAHSPR